MKSNNESELSASKPNNLCWECDVREAVPNERYCKECEAKTDWINDFYGQFED